MLILQRAMLTSSSVHTLAVLAKGIIRCLWVMSVFTFPYRGKCTPVGSGSYCGVHNATDGKTADLSEGVIDTGAKATYLRAIYRTVSGTEKTNGEEKWPASRKCYRTMTKASRCPAPPLRKVYALCVADRRSVYGGIEEHIAK